MVEYKLATDEQKLMAASAKQITEEYLTQKKIKELELADEGRGQYAMELHEQLAEAGFCGMNVPEEWGGLGLDLVTQALICEEMAKIDAGFTFGFYNSTVFFPLIAKTSMSREEKQKWADMTVAGTARGCLCFTEGNAGSDPAAMETKAVKDGDDWVINGTKCFVTNGPIANYFLVAAWTDKSQRASKGITCFFVEKERGVKVGTKENKMGIKLSETSEIVFENVRVPEDHVIGGVGQGFASALGVISKDGRPMGSAVCLGIAQGALDHAVAYSMDRRTFSKRICDHQGLGFLIADMQARTDASRALLYYALSCMDNGVDPERLTSSVKLFISDNTMQTTLDAVQVLGGYGYMKDFPVEKLMRDAKIFQIFSGTNQIQRKTILGSLVGKDIFKK